MTEDPPTFIIIHRGFLPPIWETKINCLGEDVTFLNTDRRSSEKARRLCGSCPSIEPCSDWAKMIPHKTGTWAGKTYGPRGRPRTSD